MEDSHLNKATESTEDKTVGGMAVRGGGDGGCHGGVGGEMGLVVMVMVVFEDRWR